MAQEKCAMPLCYQNELASGVHQIFLLNDIENLAQILVGFPTSHRQVVQQVVSAVAGSLSGNIAFKVANEAESLSHQFNNIAAFKVALQQEIVAGAAAHRTPKDNFFAPYRVVAQESGSQMLDGVQCAVADGRFAVRLFHSYVEGSDNMVAHVVLARNVYAPQQVEMVDAKTGYFLHDGCVL